MFGIEVSNKGSCVGENPDYILNFMTNAVRFTLQSKHVMLVRIQPLSFMMRSSKIGPVKKDFTFLLSL